MLFACCPKHFITGRVNDADTHQPIAAAAIKWLVETSEQQSARTHTVDAVQALSDARRIFQIPQYPAASLPKRKSSDA
jgi:hypothetical protein